MIRISYLQHRRHFYPLVIHLLNQVDAEFEFNFLTDKSHDVDIIQAYFDRYARFKSNIVVLPMRDNYKAKIRWSYNNLRDGDIFLKHDEDITYGAQLYEWFFQNAHLVNEYKDTFLAPKLANGVPTTDECVESFMDAESLAHYKKLCLQVEINGEGNTIHPQCKPELQPYYLALNKHTINAQYWDYKAFYKEVWNIPHHYRGIHPSRLSFDITKFINEYVLEHPNVLTSPQNYSIQETYDYPYFCNSIYAVSKSCLKDICDRMEHDCFDEITLNELRLERKAPMLFIKNSVGLHYIYNNSLCSKKENPHANEDGAAWELDFYNRLVQKLL